MVTSDYASGEEAAPAATLPATQELTLEGALSITQATASLDAFCARVESEPKNTVAIVWMRDCAKDQPWPDAVSVTDINRWERAVRRFERLAAVTLAAAEGICGGPALDLLLASDFRLARSNMELLFPINGGQFWPGMSLYRLSLQIGIARARQVILWGRDMNAARCVEVGLVDEIVKNLAAAVQTTAPALGRQSGAELAVRRHLLLEAPSTSFEDALGTHLAACDRELRKIQANKLT